MRVQIPTMLFCAPKLKAAAHRALALLEALQVAISGHFRRARRRLAPVRLRGGVVVRPPADRSVEAAARAPAFFCGTPAARFEWYEAWPTSHSQSQTLRSAWHNCDRPDRMDPMAVDGDQGCDTVSGNSPCSCVRAAVICHANLTPGSVGRIMNHSLHQQSGSSV